ncbi:hypothetical protein Tdes44962_MAKER01251 [Teratosphaeria destructans]|uniref:Uncharacterized protein n=1 Tax=Teratosphaeria destructans TaxID=418781 RepID=A0A9W7W724_9PEZI|nr:hypothetical protein Tdes44962_MAKER01251 [Teratosphaeria destructans]
MVAQFQQRSSQSAAFWTLAGLAFVSQVVLAAIIINLTATDVWTPPEYRAALATSVLDLLALISLLTAVGVRRSSSADGRTAVCALSVLIVFAAVSLSIIVLSWTLQNTTADGPRDLAIAGLVFCITATATQTVFHGYLLWPQTKHSATESTAAIPAQRPSPVRSVKSSISIRLGTLSPTPHKHLRPEPLSPADSGYGSSPSSLRTSFYAAVRPITSRTWLMRNSSVSLETPSVLSSTRRPSFDAPRQDGFESWDTSAVVEVYRPPTLVGSTRLETIPGSRPVSPARVLDGPFEEGSKSGKAAQSNPAAERFSFTESPLISPILPTPDTGSIRGYPTSHSRRPSNGQSHIHPLFRTESPIPPPVASPGTVIFASYQAGQVVSPEALVPRVPHSAQSNRPGSTTPTCSRTGSVVSMRMHAASLEPPTISTSHESSLPCSD